MDVDQLLFSGGQGLARTFVFGVLVYAILIVFMRIAGKRTLARMNTFDLIVNVSIGSVIASTLLIKSVALTQGVFALATLIGLQFLVTWSSVRISGLRRFITGEPSILLKQGAFVPASLRRARVTEDEVRAAVRSAGIGNLGSVEAVVLETNGSFSVIKKMDGAGASILEDVKDYSTTTT